MVKLELLNTKLENNLKLILSINTKKFQNKYILYFPKDACNACLEQIILTLSDKQAIWNDFILYSENEQLKDIVDYLTDAYSLNFNFEIGSRLFNCQTNNPVFMKFEENRISQLFEINREDITKLDSLMKNYEILIQ